MKTDQIKVSHEKATSSDTTRNTVDTLKIAFWWTTAIESNVTITLMLHPKKENGTAV
jgi:hypothetical protein